jgi:ABC-type amino acid transport substrate-binding protein
MDTLITALSNGEISAAFTHESTVLYWELNGSDQFRPLGNPVRVGEGIVIMATPKNADLIKKINQQIQTLEQSSFYLNLYTTYFANEK